MLTDKAISGLKGQAKAYRVSDSGGLYIEVRPDGSKYWRQAYRFAGKQKPLAHGVYPTIGLNHWAFVCELAVFKRVIQCEFVLKSALLCVKVQLRLTP